MWLVMVTIIKLTQWSIGNCKIRNLLLCPNGLTDLSEIWNQDSLGDDASFEEKISFYEIGPGIFKVLNRF